MRCSKPVIRYKVIFAVLIGSILVQLKISTAGTCPCDIYASGGTPCVAAYSTVRALYGSYDGPLYQVRRSDGQLKNIGVLTPGGYANAAVQDSFLSGTKGTISKIYDQSNNHNDLTKAPAGAKEYGPYDCIEADANALPIKVNGHKVYGLHVVGDFFGKNGSQVGYRKTNAINIPKGDNPESIYMVADGTYFSGACCFNFGNALQQPVAGGYGTMEALYFGNVDWWTKGIGTGPWVMADLEVGVYAMGGPGNYSDANKQGNKTNSQSISFPYPFVMAMLKGNSANATSGGPFTLKGGNAQSGKLTTVWDGPYPIKYSPMNKGGGVILGVGGDNSSGGQGNFFEGVMAAGYASTDADNAIHTNILAVGYGSQTTKLLDGNIKESLSSAIKVNCSKSTLKIEFTSPGNGATSVNIFNLKGNIVKTATFQTSPSTVCSHSFDLANVNVGFYLVKIDNNENSFHKSKTLLIAR